MLSDLRLRLRALLRRRAVEKELDDELRFHLDRHVDKLVQAGHTRAEAERLARLELGGLEPIKEDCRDARGTGLVDGLVQDVRYGLRVLRKSPGFTAIAVVTLALGIGANTAMFSVVNGVLLHPLPYPRPEELVRLHCSKPNFATGSISYPNFLDWQRMNRSFAAMAVARGTSLTVTGLGEPDKITGELITADFFSLLGVTPRLGRPLAAGEDQVGAAPVALVSEELWRRKLGAAPDAVGKAIVLDGRSYTIIGVMPESFDLPVRGFHDSDVYLPIGQWDNNLLMSRGSGLGIHGIGRLKPGVTVEQARADLEAVTRSLAAIYPDVDKGLGASVVPLEEAVVGNVRPYLLLLLGAVGLVLLIACVNVANLLLARAAARARELAVRLALGASFRRLLRQLLTESLLLAAAGGALGLLAAAWGTGAVVQALPASLPRVQAIGIDGRVLLFTTAVSLLAGLLFGLVPALKAARPDLHATLKDGGRSASSTRHRAQGVFVVLQMAMALVLLVGAGLMVRTLARLWSVDPGFQPRGVARFELALAPALRTAPPDAIRAELRRLDGTLAATPGVEATSLSWGSVPMGSDDELLFWPAGRPKPATLNEMSWAVKYVVGPGYLHTMGIPLRQGRFLAGQDDEHAPRVVVVDEVFARTFFPGEDAVGKRLYTADFDDGAPVEIVGVVGHVKQWGLDQDDTHALRAQVYEAILQLPDKAIALTPGGVDVLVRARGPAAPLLASLRAVTRGLGSENLIFDAGALEDLIARSLAARRFSMLVLAAFAGVALLLSCIGIYGVISYVVSQRTNEIGIRMALGARRGDVLALVLRHGVRLALAGVAIGVVAASALTRLMGDLLYGVAATDPITFAGVAAGLTLVALTASYLPARRAARVDPMSALRHE